MSVRLQGNPDAESASCIQRSSCRSCRCSPPTRCQFTSTWTAEVHLVLPERAQIGSTHALSDDAFISLLFDPLHWSLRSSIRMIHACRLTGSHPLCSAAPPGSTSASGWTPWLCEYASDKPGDSKRGRTDLRHAPYECKPSASGRSATGTS